MVDEDPPTDSRTGMNLNAGDPAREHGQESRQPTKGAQVALPEPMGEPVKPNGM
jgi:hypothetical protein